MNKVIIAGATQGMVDQVVIPMLSKSNTCEYILVTTDSLEVDHRLARVFICSSIPDVIETAIEQVKQYPKSVLMKGNVHTAHILKAVLKSDNGLKTNQLLSIVSQVNLPDGRTFLLTDAGLNTNPKVEDKIKITENAVAVAKKLGWKPIKVALLSAIEVVNPKIQSSIDANIVAQHFKQMNECIIEGPISFDVAIAPDAANIKGYTGKIQGDANILVVPGIDSGNILYKTLVKLVHAKTRGILVGAKIPVVVTSRSDNPQSKVDSLLMALNML